MILRSIEGIVKEVVDDNFLKIIPSNERESKTGREKKLRFTGIEEWIGNPHPLQDLIGCKVSVYGWEDNNDEVHVFAIAKLY